jgi:hypothetical protein
MFNKPSPLFLAFLQATGLFVYVELVSLFFLHAESIFSDSAPQFYGPLLGLLLFVVSAVISATLVLGRFGVLFWEKKYKAAFTLLGYTTAWILFYIGLVVFCVLRP